MDRKTYVFEIVKAYMETYDPEDGVYENVKQLAELHANLNNALADASLSDQPEGILINAAIVHEPTGTQLSFWKDIKIGEGGTLKLSIGDPFTEALSRTIRESQQLPKITPPPAATVSPALDPPGTPAHIPTGDPLNIEATIERMVAEALAKAARR